MKKIAWNSTSSQKKLLMSKGGTRLLQTIVICLMILCIVPSMKSYAATSSTVNSLSVNLQKMSGSEIKYVKDWGGNSGYFWILGTTKSALKGNLIISYSKDGSTYKNYNLTKKIASLKGTGKLYDNDAYVYTENSKCYIFVTYYKKNSKKTKTCILTTNDFTSYKVSYMPEETVKKTLYGGRYVDGVRKMGENYFVGTFAEEEDSSIIYYTKNFKTWEKISLSDIKKSLGDNNLLCYYSDMVCYQNQLIIQVWSYPSSGEDSKYYFVYTNDFKNYKILDYTTRTSSTDYSVYVNSTGNTLNVANYSDEWDSTDTSNNYLTLYSTTGDLSSLKEVKKWEKISDFNMFSTPYGLFSSIEDNVIMENDGTTEFTEYDGVINGIAGLSWYTTNNLLATWNDTTIYFTEDNFKTSYKLSTNISEIHAVCYFKDYCYIVGKDSKGKYQFYSAKSSDIFK